MLGVAGDGCVARGDAGGRVGHQERHVGAFQMSAGHDYAQLLRDQVRFAFAANACRINEAIALAAAQHERIDNVARGAGFGGDDGALGAGQLIQQRRFPYVRAADDGYLHFPILRRIAVLFRRRKIARQCVEQIVHAQPVLRRKRKYRCANLVKLSRQILLPLRVHFVDGNDERFARSPQVSC